MNRIRFPLLALFAVLLAACGSMPSKQVDSIAEYGSAVRWSEWDAAWTFVDPANGGGGQLPASERARLEHVKVSGYTVRSRVADPDGLKVRQVVEIRYIDQATQREISVTNAQAWRTDDAGKHWVLISGLPQF